MSPAESPDAIRTVPTMPYINDAAAPIAISESMFGESLKRLLKPIVKYL